LKFAAALEVAALACALSSQVGDGLGTVGQLSYVNSRFPRLPVRACAAMLDDPGSHQETPMATPQNPTGSDDSRESLDGQPPPVPDEDGPHDVPDDKVIEKTLPSAPIADSGGPRSGGTRDKPRE
jgi:hypothetical protein